MRLLLIALGGCLLTSATPGSAQTLIAPTAPPSSVAPDRQVYDASQFRAPVGNRQPRLTTEPTPAEPVRTDPVDDLAREDAMLARRINGICRGC